MKQLRLITIRICCILIVSCITLGTAWGQAVTITGKILDEAGEGVIGASVLQKGTTNGTITDIDGNFTLNNVPEDATLVASFIGYKTEEIKLNKKRFVTLVLKEDTQNLEEIVVVGYGVQRKSDLTGSVSSVKAGDAIKNTPSSDITSSLQGRLAGVSIVSNSGQPGSGSTIRVRGMNSLKADQGPLLVVDGFIGGTLSSLNPSDIQSIEVLKDASATAVYGSRGANGVILVTTKNPEKGKINVNYNGYANFKTPYELPDMLSPGEFAELANDYGQEYYTAAGRDPMVYYTPEQVEAYKRGEGGYDYVGNVFRNMSFQHTHELSVSGSSEKTRYLISGSYNDDEGIVRNSRAQQFNYRVKVDTDIKSWLRVGVNSWGYYTTSQGPRFSQYRGVLIESMIFPNTILPKDENGKYNNMNLKEGQYNPMGHIWEIDNENYNITNRIQGYVDVTLLKGLTFRMTQGFVFGNSNSSSVDNAN
ncbi:MAG: SusC/RagA family TonB-linked outer membrane protein, partial [Bacteroidales bacterium]